MSDNQADWVLFGFLFALHKVIKQIKSVTSLEIVK